MAPESIKCTFRISGEAREALETLAAKRGISLTDVFRQALTTEAFLQRELEAGREILIRDPETRETNRLVFR